MVFSSKLITAPLLAGTIEDLETIRFPVIASPKLDGIRCLKLDGKAMSRTFKPLPNAHIQDFFSKLKLPDGLDGEIITFTDGKPDSFNDIQSKVMSEDGEFFFSYNMFDYVKDDPNKPFVLRIEELFKLKQQDQTLAIDQKWIEDIVGLKEYIEVMVDGMGHEGVMIRDPKGPYKMGRSGVKEQILCKIKKFQDDEGIVIGFTEKLTNMNKAEKDAFGHTKRSSHKANKMPANTLGAILVKWGDVTFEVGSGYNDEQRKEIWENQSKYLGKKLTFKYQGIGSKGRPRFPIWLGFRNDI